MKMKKIAFAIGVGIFMFLIFEFFTVWFVEDVVAATGIAISMASCIYFPFFSPLMFRIVPPDFAWVVSNSLITESAVRRPTFSGYRDIIAQSEYQAGKNIMWPWEGSATVVDMRRSFILSGDEKDVYTLSDGNVVIIIWQLIYVPMPGYLVNYVRTSPEDIRRRLIARVRTYIQGYVGSLNKQQFTYGASQQADFVRAFERVFGGPQHLDDEEKALGVWTGTPAITDIDQVRAVQEITAILDAITDKARSAGISVAQAADIIIATNARANNVTTFKLAA